MVERKTNSEWLKKWKAAKDSVNAGPIVPVGASYKMLLKQGIYKPTKKGAEMITFVYEVLEGDYKGKEHRACYFPGSDYGLGLLAQDLEILSYPTDAFNSKEDLIETVEKIGDDKIHLVAAVTENPDPKYANYPKTRIESLLEGDEPSGDVVDATVVDETPVEDEAKAEAEDSGAVVDDSAEEEPVEEEPEPEAEPEEEDDGNADVGDTVRFTFKKKSYKGIIKVIGEEVDSNGNVTLKISSGGKLYPVKQDKVDELVEKAE